MSEILKKDREVITLREGSSTAADYYRLPENIACELIQGHIVMQAAPTRRHQEILGNLFFEIKDFIQKNKGDCSIYPAPFAVELDDKNVYEPDISVICDESKLTDRGCSGAPDWIIEIVSPSTAQNDYLKKLNGYGSAGVREYWIVDPIKEKILVWSFEDSGLDAAIYTFSEKVPAGIYKGELSLAVK